MQPFLRFFRRRASSTREVQLFASEDFCRDVGPEFLEDVVEDSGFHLYSPVLHGLTRLAVVEAVLTRRPDSRNSKLSLAGGFCRERQSRRARNFERRRSVGL